MPPKASSANSAKSGKQPLAVKAVNTKSANQTVQKPKPAASTSVASNTLASGTAAASSSSASTTFRSTKRPGTEASKAAVKVARRQDKAASARDAYQQKEQRDLEKRFTDLDNFIVASLQAPTTSSAKDALVQALDTVRKLDKRPLLSGKERLTLQTSISEDLAGMLISLFKNPFHFTPSLYPHLLQPAQSYADRTLAQYYLRQLVFPSFNNFEACLLKAVASKPQYTSVALALISYAPRSGPLSLYYAGMTIANSPVGRQEEDEVLEESFFTAVLAIYLESDAAQVQVWELIQMRFEVVSVIGARADIRTSLFEQLVVGSIGYRGLNTAAGGLCLDIDMSAEASAANDKLDSWESSEIRSQFPWLA